jgi:hypothetical protein
MGQNTNSLVGVAISASLLPPMVNTGLLWAQASLNTYFYVSDCVVGNQTVGDSLQMWNACCAKGSSEPCAVATDVAYPDFCCYSAEVDSGTIGLMGFVSLLLTVVNIVCIWVFGSGMFYFKEIAPLPNKSQLWSYLVPKAREYNNAVNNGLLSPKKLEKELKEALEEKRKRQDPPVYGPVNQPQARAIGLQSRAFGETGFSSQRFLKTDGGGAIASSFWDYVDRSKENEGKKVKPVGQ